MSRVQKNKTIDVGVATAEKPGQPYEKPSVTRVDLALEETMSQGCKLGADAGCVGPPIAAFDSGS